MYLWALSQTQHMSPNVVIRPINPEDNTELAKVIRQVFIEHGAPQHGTVFSDPTTDDLYNLFREERSVLWVALIDDQIMGCCGVYPTPGLGDDTVELVKFYLDADARGHGIGKKLLEYSMRSAVELGFKRMYIESLPHYAKAVSIYEQLGFTHLDHPMGESGHTTCNIWMIRDL